MPKFSQFEPCMIMFHLYSVIFKSSPRIYLNLFWLVRVSLSLRLIDASFVIKSWFCYLSESSYVKIAQSTFGNLKIINRYLRFLHVLVLLTRNIQRVSIFKTFQSNFNDYWRIRNKKWSIFFKKRSVIWVQ